MSNYSGGSQPRTNNCPIQGWTAPDDAAANRQAWRDTHPTPLPYRGSAPVFSDPQPLAPQASQTTPLPQSFNPAGHSGFPDAMGEPSMNPFRSPGRTDAYGSVFGMSSGVPDSSSSWMSARADFASTSGLDQHRGIAGYGSGTADSVGFGQASQFTGGWQPPLNQNYDQMSDDLAMGPSYDPTLDSAWPSWEPAIMRRSWSYGQGDSLPFRSVPPMYHPHASSDLLPRSNTAPPMDMRRSGCSPSGGPVGERCRWGGQCQTIITDLTASGINRHLKECHVQPWDDRTRGYCQWEGSPCSKKVLFYFGFGKHIASVHVRSTASKCDMCGQILARGDTLDRHAKRFCHGRPSKPQP